MNSDLELVLEQRQLSGKNGASGMIAFEDACVESPAGVALLAALEARQRSGFSLLGLHANSSPSAVEAAVKTVEFMRFSDLCALAVRAAETLVGPWVQNAPEVAAAAYRYAEARRPIAAVIGDRFDRELHAPLNPDNQEWWTSSVALERAINHRQTLFKNYEDVYGSGQFTWAGLWTVTEPPPEIHGELINAWEMYPGPVSRWRIPTRDSARIHELHRPQDWLGLVASYPREATRPHEGWELPGPNKFIGTAALFALPQQRAAVKKLSTHLVPDWRRVAKSIDAVHLSWAGFITSEGYVMAADNGAFTMLRYWGSERTHWLNDCFGTPEPLEAPVLPRNALRESVGANLATTKRRAKDQELLNRLLGR